MQDAAGYAHSWAGSSGPGDSPAGVAAYVLIFQRPPNVFITRTV